MAPVVLQQTGISGADAFFGGKIEICQLVDSQALRALNKSQNLLKNMKFTIFVETLDENNGR